MTEGEDMAEKVSKSKRAGKSASNSVRDVEIAEKIEACQTFAELRAFLNELPEDVQKAHKDIIKRKIISFYRPK